MAAVLIFLLFVIAAVLCAVATAAVGRPAEPAPGLWHPRLISAALTLAFIAFAIGSWPGH